MNQRAPARVTLRRHLSRTWIFSDLTEPELEELAGLASTRPLVAKQNVVTKGDPGGQIFAVIRGQLKVFAPGLERDAAFRVLGPGDIFGEISAFDGQERSATVVALGPGEVAVIQQADFLRFLDVHSAVSRKLLATLARRVRQISERVEDRAFFGLQARLAKLLIGLSEEHGQDAAHGRRINVRLSQQELADLVDATRESVNKLLRAWKRAGWLEYHPDGIVVHQASALRALIDE